MLRDLSIQNYRAFGNFSIDGLMRLNLIVCMNNCGKTSFLEAVYLLINQENPLSVLELLYDRGEYVESGNGAGLVEYQLAHIFRSHDPRPNLKTPLPESIIGLQSREDAFRSLYMRLSPTVA